MKYVLCYSMLIFLYTYFFGLFFEILYKREVNKNQLYCRSWPWMNSLDFILLSIKVKKMKGLTHISSNLYLSLFLYISMNWTFHLAIIFLFLVSYFTKHRIQFCLHLLISNLTLRMSLNHFHLNIWNFLKLILFIFLLFI